MFQKNVETFQPEICQTSLQHKKCRKSLLPGKHVLQIWICDSLKEGPVVTEWASKQGSRWSKMHTRLFFHKCVHCTLTSELHIKSTPSECANHILLHCANHIVEKSFLLTVSPLHSSVPHTLFSTIKQIHKYTNAQIQKYTKTQRHD